jgi:hypothetical protein
MTMLCKLMIISALVMTPAFPAMSQQNQPQAPMMGQGQGGMVDRDEGGMMGRGGMMGQDMGGQDMSGRPMMGYMMGSGRRSMNERMGHGAMMHSVPMMEGRLAYIKADLAITDAQLAAWDAYAAAVRARHSTMESMHTEMLKAKESGSALHGLDARIKAMESQLESLRAIKPVTEALFAVLTGEQKKKADQLVGGRCGMM